LDVWCVHAEPRRTLARLSLGLGGMLIGFVKSKVTHFLVEW
jgi:hypothetical protein